MISLLDRLTTAIDTTVHALSYPNVSSGTLSNKEASPTSFKGKGKVTLLYSWVNSYGNECSVDITIDGHNTNFNMGGRKGNNNNLDDIFLTNPTFTFESSCKLFSNKEDVKYIVQLAD